MSESGGFQIGRFAGAPIVIEPTFFLFAGYLVFTNSMNGGGLAYGLTLVAALAVAVLAHELGHASAAASFKIASQRIVLTLFGGYVQFVHPPEKRWQEIIVSAAGPLTNIGCWALAFIALDQIGTFNSGDWSLQGFLSQFAWISLMLGAFNLAPAFPLDGGHILRAFLSFFLSRPRAGQIAGGLGILFAIGLGIWAVTEGYSWTAFIALFLGFAAFGEIARANAALRRASEG